MRTHIVKIGNSQGVRIPKALLEQTRLKGEVEILVRRDSLVIPAAGKARAGWETAFKQMADHGDDRLADVAEVIEHSFDAEDWEWK